MACPDSLTIYANSARVNVAFNDLIPFLWKGTRVDSACEVCGALFSRDSDVFFKDDPDVAIRTVSLVADS